jgi:hypothetical protein
VLLAASSATREALAGRRSATDRAAIGDESPSILSNLELKLLQLFESSSCCNDALVAFGCPQFSAHFSTNPGVLIVIRSALLLATLVAFTSTPAHAQARRSTAGGLTVGGGLLGASVSTNFDNVTQTESGSGLNLEIGWGFTPNWTAYLGINGSTISSDIDYSLGQADLGVRYLFRGTDKQARPYLEGAIAARTIRVDLEDDFDAVTASVDTQIRPPVAT